MTVCCAQLCYKYNNKSIKYNFIYFTDLLQKVFDFLLLPNVCFLHVNVQSIEKLFKTYFGLNKVLFYLIINGK